MEFQNSFVFLGVRGFLFRNFRLGILEFPVIPIPFGGSLYEILNLFVMRSPDQAGDDIKLRNSRIPSYFGG